MATHCYNVPIHQDVSKRYASDLNDQEFALIAPHVAQEDGSGRKRMVDIREVLNAIFYRSRIGCQWRTLPSDFPSWSHVWYDYRKWRDDNILERINTIAIIFASAIDKQFIRVFQCLCGYHGAVEDELLPGWRLLCVQKD